MVPSQCSEPDMLTLAYAASSNVCVKSAFHLSCALIFRVPPANGWILTWDLQIDSIRLTHSIYAQSIYDGPKLIHKVLKPSTGTKLTQQQRPALIILI